MTKFKSDQLDFLGEKQVIKQALDLDNVDNTSDSQKPIPNSVNTALAGKSDIGHTHTKNEITDFNDVDYATASQGLKADTAIQPGDNVSSLINDSQYLVSSDITTINGQSITQGGNLNVSGLGDMQKSIYDTNDNGIVDNSENLQGNNSSYHLNRTNHTGTQAATTVTVVPTNFKTLDTPSELQDALEKIDTLLLQARSTGIEMWSGVTDLGTGVVRITAGNGSIFNGADFFPISWVQQDINLSAVDDRYWIYVDQNGVIQTTTIEQTHEDYRTKIQLCRVVIRLGVVTGLVNTGMPIQNLAAQIWDVFRKEGLSHEGLSISPVTTNLTFQISGGEIYQAGIKVAEQPNNPHEISYSPIPVVTFREVNRNNVQTVDRTLLDFSNYDLNGVITPVSGTNQRSTIKYVFAFPTEPLNVRVLYGQAVFNDINEAISAINSSYIPIIPTNFKDAVLLGLIVGIKGATNAFDSTQVRFFNNTELLGGLTAAPSLADVMLRSNNLSDVQDISIARTNLDIYSTSEVDTLLTAKQDTLVSGTNIKTINNASIVGAGNLDVTSSNEFVSKTILTNYTVIAVDVQTPTILYVDTSSSDISITVDTESNQSYGGDFGVLIVQKGANKVGLLYEVGVTGTNYRTTVPDAAIYLVRRGINNWEVIGSQKETFTPNQPPSTPTLQLDARDTSTIDVSWTTSTDDVAVTGYRVYKDGILEATLGLVTSYQLTGLSPLTTYDITVRAFDGELLSNESNIITAKTYSVELHDDSNAAADPNGTEANDTTGWAPVQVTLTSETTDIPQTGTYHMRIVAADGSLDRADYSLPITPGETYRVSIWAKQGAQGTSGRIQLFGGFDTVPWTTVTLTTTYTNYTQNIVASGTTGVIRIYAASSGAAGDIVYFDNVSIKQVS